MSESIGSKIYETFAHPGGRRNSIEHQAHHGSALVDHNPPQGLLARLTSDETTKQIKSQGNNGVGMDDGLRAKAIAQQERVAERSRLHNEGLFESHTTHEKLTNFSPEHREVADGSKLDFDVPHTFESQRI